MYSLKVVGITPESQAITQETEIDHTDLLMVKRVTKVLKENASDKDGEIYWDTSYFSDVHPMHLYAYLDPDVEDFADFVPHGIIRIVNIEFAPKIEWMKIL